MVTVAVFARVMPAFQFSVAAVGRVVPAGYATSQPFCCGRTMVADTTIAAAPSGMPHADVLTCAVYGLTAMKPVPTRSSASRQGWTGS